MPGELKDDSEIIEGREVLGFKKLEIIGHARKQMKIRDVSVDDVFRTLQQPDETGLRADFGRERYRWNKTTRSAIDVVFEKLADRIRVVTVIAKVRRIIERRK